ncbi:hypothetical protein Slin14017_G114220 [Septoria linicola]|nr:hypothetical protein Slin14017_G114220 [Septoria linicola]
MRCGVSEFSGLDLDEVRSASEQAWDGCITLCSSGLRSVAFTFEMAIYVAGSSISGTMGNCKCWALNDYTPSSAQPNARLPIRFGSNQPTDATPYVIGAIRVQLWERFDQISFPPPQLQYLSTALITQTLLSAYPVTTNTTITRSVSLTSSFTRTISTSTVLPDLTATLPQIQIIPTTVITLQVITSTIVSISTQLRVTVIPTIVPQTALSTLALQSTIVNTQTATAIPVTTLRPVEQAQQTITITS